MTAWKKKEDEEDDEEDEWEGEENGESEDLATASEVEEKKPPTEKMPKDKEAPAKSVFTIGLDEETKADVVSDIDVKAPKPINEHNSF